MIPEVSEEDDGGDRHGEGHGDSVGGGKLGRCAEADDETDAGDGEDPVYRRDVDLAFVLGRGVEDFNAGKEAELDGLPGEREGAGDDGLAGNNGSGGGENDDRENHPRGDDAVEGVVDVGGVGEDMRPLAEIIKKEAGEDDGVPAAADGTAIEVAEVGVDSFASRGDEEDGSEDDEPVARILEEKRDSVAGVEGGEDAGCFEDGDGSKDAEDGEPEEDDRAKEFSQTTGATFLNGKEGGEDCDGDPIDVGTEGGGDAVQPFNRAEHGDGGGDHAIAVEEAGGENTERGERPTTPGSGADSRGAGER